MGDDAKRLLDEALRLDAGTRALIAETLLESLDLDDDVAVSEGWQAEILRRCADLDTSAVAAVDGDAVMQELRDKYAR